MISTHILDTCRGVPASGVSIQLALKVEEDWKVVSAGTTNEDGRFVFDCAKVPGVYRIVFEVDKYFLREMKESFFPSVPVVFKVEDTQRKYHVPLLLNPYGYSTYRGT